MTQAELNTFAAAFQECAIPKPAWTHLAHLKVGFWHVRSFGKSDALDRLRAGIRRLNDSHGVPNSETRGYHETITRVYVQLIDEFISRLSAVTSVEDTLKRLLSSRLVEKNFLLSFYSRDLLMSPRARFHYVEADLAPVRFTPFCLSSPTDRIRTPWKNGQGWTEEVAVFPAGAALDAFDWRVSFAGTDRSSAFSLFPAMDRSLALLQGKLSLSLDGQAPIEIHSGSDPLFFSGDVSTVATLREEPLVDLNVITRRDRFVHRMQRYRMNQPTTVPLGSGITLIVSVATRDVMIFEQPSGTATHPIDCGDCLIIRIDPR